MWLCIYQTLYETPETKIGKHLWKAVVYRYRSERAYLDYLWFDSSRGRWRSSEEWPTWNSNDGTYAGCPKTLVRLYERHKTQIDAALSQAQGEQAA